MSRFRSVSGFLPAMPPPILGVQGPDAARAAHKLDEGANSNISQWPYPWIYPPPKAQNQNPFNSIPAPQVGDPAVILAYKVPLGMRFWLQGIIQQYAGSGFVQGSGSALWTLDKDTPLGNGSVQGSPIAWFTNQPFTLGSFDSGPFMLAMPEVFEASSVIRSKVITTAAITPGSPNFFTTILIGYTVPAE